MVTERNERTEKDAVLVVEGEIVPDNKMTLEPRQEETQNGYRLSKTDIVKQLVNIVSEKDNAKLVVAYDKAAKKEAAARITEQFQKVKSKMLKKAGKR